MPTPSPEFALSLKQPWAALLVHGYKTIEIRRWPTARRGSIWIHAAAVADSRPEVWQRVPDPVRDAAQLAGGLVGVGDLIDCRCYRDARSFAADQNRHWNDPSWFEGPVLFGFEFTNVQPLPFRRYRGERRFFVVDLPGRHH